MGQTKDIKKIKYKPPLSDNNVIIKTNYASHWGGNVLEEKFAFVQIVVFTM